MSSPTRIGREVGDQVVVKLVVAGTEVLAYGVVLRLAQSGAEMHLVAFASITDARARENQILVAGGVLFIPMNVRGADMFKDVRTACQVTGLEMGDVPGAPDVGVVAAVAAFESAIAGGFLSASGSDADVQGGPSGSAAAPTGQPAGVCVQVSQPYQSFVAATSTPSTSSFVDISAPVRPPVDPGLAEVMQMLQVISAGQQNMLGRIERLERGAPPGLSPVRPVTASAPCALMPLAKATPGINAMQSAGAVLANAPGWGPSGQTPRPPSLASASTTPCPAYVQPSLGQTAFDLEDHESGPSDAKEGNAGKTRGPPLIAEAAARRQQRHQQPRLADAALPGVPMGKATLQSPLGSRAPAIFQQPVLPAGSVPAPALPHGMPGFQGLGPPSFAPPLQRHPDHSSRCRQGMRFSGLAAPLPTSVPRVHSLGRRAEDSGPDSRSHRWT